MKARAPGDGRNRTALRGFVFLLLLVGTSVDVPKTSAQAVSQDICFEATPWPEADRLFRDDPFWLGADAASTVDLKDGRILWLFGDTWISPNGSGSREGARMVSNSVAIQRGSDPSGASMRFFWGHADDGTPEAFVPDRLPDRHWFGNGVLVGDHLILFMGRIHAVDWGLGFESSGWAAWLVDNPGDDPDDWTLRELEVENNHLGVPIGFGAVDRQADTVYAFGSSDPVKSHPVYAVRWPSTQLYEAVLSPMEWWAGRDAGWVSETSQTPRWPIFENGASEFSIHRDADTGSYLAVHAQGFGAADIVFRSAPAVEGPWSDPRLLFHPPERNRPNVLIYAAKAHPELTGADLIVTYATNTTQFEEHLSDPDVYYPHFVRAMRCE